MSAKALRCSLALLCLAACGGDDDEGEGKDAEELGLSCPSDSKVTYEDDIKPFMEKYCTRCHATDVPASQRNGAPLDHNFDTEAGILAEAHHVVEEAAAGPNGVNTGMPEGSGAKPSTAERKLLGEWLACNADLTGDDDD